MANPAAEDRPSIEDEILARLAEIGLVVTRDPNRPTTVTEQRCFTWGYVGFTRNRRRAVHGRHPCKCWGCPRCAPRRAAREMAKFPRSQADFVGLSQVFRKFLVCTEKTDKVPDGCLWVTLTTLT
jgi:hypothetical protein